MLKIWRWKSPRGGVDECIWRVAIAWVRSLLDFLLTLLRVTTVVEAFCVFSIRICAFRGEQPRGGMRTTPAAPRRAIPLRDGTTQQPCRLPRPSLSSPCATSQHPRNNRIRSPPGALSNSFPKSHGGAYRRRHQVPRRSQKSAIRDQNTT